MKFLENIKQGFKRTISWNKYRSEITTEAKKNNLHHLIDPTLDIIRLFFFSFKNDDDDPTRNSFDEYYMPSVEIKDFNALIDNKPYFDQPVKNKQAYEKVIEMSRNNDCTNVNIPQQIIFSGKLEEDDGLTMFYIAEKQQKAILNFFFRFINCNRII